MLTLVKGTSLWTQIQQAILMSAKHEGFLTRFTARFSPEVIEKWSAMIDAWDADQTKPNPYEEPQIGMDNLSE